MSAQPPSCRKLALHWFLPTSGDGRSVGDGARTGIVARDHRPATIDYLAQIARAAEQLGFQGVLTPTGTWCEDAWVTTAALVRETTRIRFLTAFRPGLLSPTLAAQMASTFQRVSAGRLDLNLVTGGEDSEQRRFGDWLDHDERYQRTDEFLTVMRGAWSDTPLTFSGSHYTVEGATTLAQPERAPRIYFGGASPPAEEVAARHADVYLMWGEPPGMVAERIERMRERADRARRELRFGIRLHVITRERSKEAWDVAARLLDAMDAESVATAQAVLAASASTGQQRMLALHGGRRDSLEVAPNLWAGIGLVRGGAGTALVGSHEDVAERLDEYRALGIDEVILSGYPHLEEAYWFAEGVMPLLERAPADTSPR
jgi:alkanesulfonate monooxygenase